jgi:single-strand DNA-binding protein
MAMAGETYVTVVGNLTADPELRHTQSGLAVANFTIASTPRSFDRDSAEWKDGETMFMRCSIWRDYAEHVAGSLSKGLGVIASGRLVQRSYETKEGESRTSLELECDHVGPTLQYATAEVKRSARKGSTAAANTSAGGDGFLPIDAPNPPTQGDTFGPAYAGEPVHV